VGHDLIQGRIIDFGVVEALLNLGNGKAQLTTARKNNVKLKLSVTDKDIYSVPCVGVTNSTGKHDAIPPGDTKLLYRMTKK
jgi:hypothetical protein